MSIRRYPDKVVPVLLAYLHKAKEYAENHHLASRFEEIEKELKGMTNTFQRIKTLEKDVREHLSKLEEELDDDIFFDCKDLEIQSRQRRQEEKLNLIKEEIAKLSSLVSWVDKGVTMNLSTMTFKHRDYSASMEDEHRDYSASMEDDLRTVSQEWVDLQIEEKIFKSEAMSSLYATFNRLESSQVKMCLLCLSIFPENSVIKKKPVVYWWMGEGLVTRNGSTTAEEVGEQVMQELLSEGFIRASSKKKPASSVHSFMVCPWIRRMLIRIAKESRFLNFDTQWTPCNDKCRAFLWQKRNDELKEENNDKLIKENVLTVFNMNEQYLRTRPEWNTGLKNVEVLQLGRWQHSATHHIEVEDERVLNDSLGSQKHLKYLSLRGISRIETLPPSISKLISLQILDLRACHNLENIPQGISALRNLTHLDVSECYLLESMPKGLDQLFALQVLKGFVIGTVGKNSGKISDLARLKYLRKLSIRVQNQDEDQQKDRLSSLSTFKALHILAISWPGISPATEADTNASLPSSLTKLDLQFVPFAQVPQWLWPSKLPNLNKLYINGGKLNTLNHNDYTKLKWESVKFVRLKYLKELNVDLVKWKSLFLQQLHLETFNCLSSCYT